MASVGELVSSARRRAGLNKAELARLAGIDRGMLVRIEQEELSGSVDTLIALASVLDIDLNLLKREVRPSPASIAETTESERGAA